MIYTVFTLLHLVLFQYLPIGIYIDDNHHQCIAYHQYDINLILFLVLSFTILDFPSLNL